MKTIEDYKKSGYFGNDVNLSISLFEYGLICKVENDTFSFVYGVWIDDSGNYTDFDFCTYTKQDIQNLIYESWFDLSAVQKFVGVEYNFSDNYDCFNFISNSISYYGYENIFGSTYYTHKISAE